MKFKTPNIRHLRVFLEVVTSKSISKASKNVFLSQPAITQAISKLEKNLEATLFERRNNGMFVTKSGEAYAYRVNRALEIILEGTKAAIRVSANKKDMNKRDVTSTHSLQMLTTTQLRALIAVSETQNFSLAGRNLGISQSSLHRAARELENQLGLVFFEKTKTGINTSKSARILARASKLAFAEIAQGRDEVNSLHNREVGHIMVGCMPLSRASLMPNAINEFSLKYPDFSLSVSGGPYDDLLFHLRHGDFDLLIGALRFPIPTDDIIQEELFTSTICIAARNDHPLCEAKNVPLSTLAKYPWVAPPVSTPTHSIFKTFFENTDMPSKIVETSSQELMRGILLDSDRLSFISEEQIYHELKAGILKKISVNIEQGPRPIGITMRKDWKPTETQLYFIKNLRKYGQLLNRKLSG